MSKRTKTAWISAIIGCWTGLFGFAEPIRRVPAVEATDHTACVLITARNTQTAEVAKATGVLVAPNVVLTAAHGVTRFDAWDVTAPYAKGGPATSKVRLAKSHPEFGRDPIPNDLAVMILEDKIDIGREFPSLHAGELYPIETPLVVVGRVANGRLSNERLYKGTSKVVPFPGNTNAYGGNPQTVQEGDSGGPVFVAGRESIIVAIVSGNLSAGRANVRTDAFTPIHRKNKPWITRQMEAAEKP